jgi:hypothetical protein
MRYDDVFTAMAIRVVIDDGGREAAGFKGYVGDCVTRAIAIATGKPYREVYDEINAFAKSERNRRGKIGRLAAEGDGSNARTGVLKPTSRAYIESLGWIWTPTMLIGQGCKVHLRANELPEGRLIVAVSRHLTAVIDRVVHDTHDPSRDGMRCVYGYWRHP